MKIILTIALAMMLIFSGISLAAESHVLVTLASGRVLTRENAVISPASDLSTLPEEEYYIIYIGRPTAKDIFSRLQKEGKIEDYIHPYSYVMKISKNAIQSLRQEGIVQYGWYYKSPHVAEKALWGNQKAMNAHIYLFESAEKDSILAKLKNLNIPFTEKESIIVEFTNRQLEEVVKISGIEAIEGFQSYEVANDETRAYLNIDRVMSVFGLFGENQIVAVADTGFDIGAINQSMHHDFWEVKRGQFSSRVLRITDYVPPETGLSHSPDDKQGHGTHVSGTILGSGFLSTPHIPPKTTQHLTPPGSPVSYQGTFAGMAPHAELIFGAFGMDDPHSNSFYISGSGDIYYLYNYFYPDGAKVMSNSWTCTSYSCPTSPYKKSSKSTDKYIYDHKDFTVVYAAGNFYSYNSVKPPGNAKNTIQVGAADHNYTLASFSSKGPTDDGRIKPDIIAPGVSIVSTKSQVGEGSCTYPYPNNPNYGLCTGTSMATPAMSGFVTLIREYYQRYEQRNASAALIKATLINGATNILNYGIPSAEAGWGFADIENSLPQGKKTIDALEGQSLWSGDVFRKRVYIHSGTPLTATLVWTDVDGAVDSNRTLVSDLDFVITDSHGKKYHGNDVSAPFDDTKDAVNNVEKITIPSPADGFYTLEVQAFNTPMGAQDFAIVATYNPVIEAGKPYSLQ